MSVSQTSAANLSSKLSASAIASIRTSRSRGSAPVRASVGYGCAPSVLAASDPSQVGKKQTEFFECQGNAVAKLYNLAEAVGIITAAQRKAAADRHVGLDVDETLLKGRQFCADVKMEPNMRKNAATGQRDLNPEKPGPYPRIGFDTYSVTSERAKDVPKDPQFIALLGKTMPPPPAGATVTTGHADGSATTRVQPPPAPPATSGGGMDW